jgi:long-chain acyl-CoA synthetase
MFELPIQPGEQAFDHFCNHLDRMLNANLSKEFADLANGIISYDALAQDMRRFAVIFGAKDLIAGDRVLVASKDERAVVTLFLALLRSGLTPVIGDADITGPELGELLEVCQPAAIIADDAMFNEAELEGRLPTDRIMSITDVQKTLEITHDPGVWPEIETRPEVALLVLTSGTTSTPKAVELTYENLIAQLTIFKDIYGFDSATRLLNLLPLHHVDGLIRGPLVTLWFGGYLFRQIPFSVQNVPEIMKKFADRKITHFITVPAMLRIIDRIGSDNRQAFSGPDFRFILCSADLLDAALWGHVQETYNVPVVNAYGLSEVVCDALFAGPDNATRRIGSLGRPYGCKADILDDNGNPVSVGETGELVLSGPTVMRGYFNAPDLTANVLKNGAFHTGDYARVGEDGLYDFVGRKKTAIVSAGATIHPESVTIVLSTMPDVAEAVAFGVPDAARGEKLVAAIAPKPGTTITSADVSAFCRKHLSAERTPAEYRIMTSLPRGASGKVLMAELTSAKANALNTLAEEQAEFDEGSGSLEEKVCAVAAKCFNVDAGGLSVDSTPFNTDGWDSLAHMTLIEELELTFDIQFSAAEIASMASLGDAMEFVEEAVKSNV